VATTEIETREREMFRRLTEPGTDLAIPDLVAGVQEEIAQIELLLKSREVVLPKGHRKIAKRKVRQLRKVIRATQAGYEPTTPPATWYAGWYKEPDQAQAEMSQTIRAVEVAAAMWPAVTSVIGFRGRWRGLYWKRFVAPVPSWAVKRYRKASRLFGRDCIMVYSPEPNDFVEEVTPLPCEPVFIGCIDVSATDLRYFTIARWEIGRDLDVLYRNLQGQQD